MMMTDMTDPIEIENIDTEMKKVENTVIAIVKMRQKRKEKKDVDDEENEMAVSVSETGKGTVQGIERGEEIKMHRTV